MSWFIKSVGTCQAVHDEIMGNASLAPHLKEALMEICRDKPWDGGYDGLLIEGSGHSGDGSNITALKVERVKLAKASAPQSGP